MTSQQPAFNPFVHIPGWVIAFVVAYVAIYELILPGVQLFMYGSYYSTDLYLLFALSCISVALAYWPLFMKMEPKGILHPLIFPLLWMLVKNLVQEPAMLITPFYQETLSFVKTTTSTLSISEAGLINANLKFRILEIISFAALYAGYFTTPGTFSLRIRKVRTFAQLKPGLLIIGLIGVAAVLVFFQMNGGVSAYMSSWGTSRAKAQYGQGPISAFFYALVVIPQLWFFYKGKKAIRNPFFLLFFVTFLFVGFFTTGSRSSILLGMIGYFIIWMVKGQRLPTFSGVAFLAFFFILFGLLGMVRRSVFDNKVDLHLLVNADLGEVIQEASQESSKRAASGADVAVIYAVPEHADYLYGKTYLAGVFFWVPRLLWEGKPNGAGRYAGNQFFSTTAAIPTGEIAEAYWNFSWLGVMLLFFLKGILSRFAANFYLENPLHPVHMIFFIFLTLFGLSVYTVDLVKFFQLMLFSIVFFKFLRLI